MPIYVYKALDPKGKMMRGEMEAVSEIELTTQLAKRGYLPVNISFKTEKTGFFLGKFFKETERVNPRALVIFTRQFATIVKAAVPIIEGLAALAEQSEDPALKRALNQIVRDVEGGTSLSQAMAKYPRVFHELYVNTVIAGESGGVLDKVLLRLSEMLEDEQENRTNIKSAMRYPIMVLILLCVAIFVLSVFVVPQFAKIYLDAGIQLPLPTQIMILISRLMRDYWYLIISLIICLFFVFRRLINTKWGRWLWDGWKFNAPIIGKVYVKITMLRFASMLNVLYQAGLPILRTLDIVGSTIGNVVLNKVIELVKRDVSEGKGISGAILNSKSFPRLVGYMISVGEKSGSLPMMLDSLCDYFYLEVKTTLKNLTTMIEPLMTVILAVVVMGMALAIFLPLWDMIQVFRGQ